MVVGSSIYSAVSSAGGLRTAARIQQQLISMGGTMGFESAESHGAAAYTTTGNRRRQRRSPLLPAGIRAVRVEGQAADRGWEYWKQLVAAEVAGQRSGGATAPPSASPDQAIIDDLVLANRMLASKELGILDAFGHVSVRNPRNPNHYFISRYVSAGVVKASDIIENDLDSRPVAGPRSDEYQEVYMHGGDLQSQA